MFDSVYPKILSLVEKWSPKKFSKETEYRDDLLKYLRNNMNQKDPFGITGEVSIRKESGRSLADIGVERRVGIELKYNVNTKSKVDRLFGQMDDYLKEYENMIVVLCGKTSEESLDYLNEKVRRMPRDLFSQKEIKIIIKDGKKKHASKNPFDLEETDVPLFGFGESKKKKGKKKNPFDIF